MGQRAEVESGALRPDMEQGDRLANVELETGRPTVNPKQCSCTTEGGAVELMEDSRGEAEWLALVEEAGEGSWDHWRCRRLGDGRDSETKENIIIIFIISFQGTGGSSRWQLLEEMIIQPTPTVFI